MGQHGLQGGADTRWASMACRDGADTRWASMACREGGADTRWASMACRGRLTPGEPAWLAGGG